MTLGLAARASAPLLLAALVAAGPAGAPRAAESDPQVRPADPPDQSPTVEPEAEAEEESDWKFSVGAIGGIKPSWLGSDNYSLGYAPDYSAAWRDRVFLKNERVGVNLVKTKGFRAGLDARRARGRNDNATDLDGVEGVDDAIEIGGFLRYDPGPLRLHLEYRQDVGIGHGGSLGVFAASTKVTLAKVLTFRARAEATLASGDYMDAFFGVDAESAADSGLDRYEAKAGFRDVGLTLSTGYEITEHWTLGLRLVYRRLVGEAADSPIVKDRGSPNQFRAGLGLSFNF